MISVTIYQNGGRYTGFLCKGHAGYDQEGYDIVCAAVSALTVNTVNSIETLTDDAMRVDEKPEGGYLKLELPDEVSEETNLLMKSLVLGLQAIEKAYGSQFLTVTFAGESQENMD